MMEAFFFGVLLGFLAGWGLVTHLHKKGQA